MITYNLEAIKNIHRDLREAHPYCSLLELTVIFENAPIRNDRFR